MKIALCAAAIALLSAAVLAGPAQADTIVEDFTVSGTAVENNSGFEGITSSSFADFNTAVGTLTGVTLSFSGTANSTSVDLVFFDHATPASDVQTEIFTGSGIQVGPGSFSISANGTVSDAGGLSFFEGSGTQALVFDFFVSVGTVTMSGQSGTLTYDFTPAVAAVPEPSTWAMMTLGFGLMGFLGYRKTRGASA
jgi:type 1 fimbria pilin